MMGKVAENSVEIMEQYAKHMKCTWEMAFSQYLSCCPLRFSNFGRLDEAFRSSLPAAADCQRSLELCSFDVSVSWHRTKGFSLRSVSADLGDINIYQRQTDGPRCTLLLRLSLWHPLVNVDMTMDNFLLNRLIQYKYGNFQ